MGLILRVVRDEKLLDFIVDRAQGQLEERPKATEEEVVRGSLSIVPLIVGAQRQLAEWLVCIMHSMFDDPEGS